jgi:acyl transferase domain-containing protein
VLKAAMKPYTSKTGFCAIGSTKANIGYLEGAAGPASLIKTVLMLKHRKLPRMLRFEALSPFIRLDDSPFFINTELMDWVPRNGKSRLVGVSSFGMTGNNAHVVVEEYVAPVGETRRRTLELTSVPVLIPPVREEPGAAQDLRAEAAGRSEGDAGRDECSGHGLRARRGHVRDWREGSGAEPRRALLTQGEQAP